MENMEEEMVSKVCLYWTCLGWVLHRGVRWSRNMEGDRKDESWG